MDVAYINLKFLSVLHYGNKIIKQQSYLRTFKKKELLGIVSRDLYTY